MTWIKARKSVNNGACVEVRREWDNGVPMVAVRDSKQNGALNQTVLIYTLDEWAAFLDGAKKGEFDGLLIREAS